jgi:hypothetical protein
LFLTINKEEGRSLQTVAALARLPEHLIYRLHPSSSERRVVNSRIDYNIQGETDICEAMQLRETRIQTQQQESGWPYCLLLKWNSLPEFFV